MYPHIRYGKKVITAIWDKKTCLWTVEAEDGSVATANVVISGTEDWSVATANVVISGKKDWSVATAAANVVISGTEQRCFQRKTSKPITVTVKNIGLITTITKWIS